MIDRYTTGLCASYFCCCCLIKVTDTRRSDRFCPLTSSACLADFTDRMDILSFPAERFNIVHIPDIVNVWDERDVGVGPAGQAQLVGNGFLELDERIHIGTGSSEHIV